MKSLLLGLVACLLEFSAITVATPAWRGRASGTNPCPGWCSRYGQNAVQRASVRVCQAGLNPGWILTHNALNVWGTQEQTHCWSVSTNSRHKDPSYYCLCDDRSPKLSWRYYSSWSGSCSSTCNGYPQRGINGVKSVCYARDHQRMGWFHNNGCWHSNLAAVMVTRVSTSFDCLCRPVPPTFRPTPKPTRHPSQPTPRPTSPVPRPTPRPTQPSGSSPTNTPPEKCTAVCAKSNSASVSLRFLGKEIGLCRSKAGNYPGLISTIVGSINCVYINLQATRPGITQDFQCMCVPFSVQKKWSNPPSFDCSNACTYPLVPVTTGNNYVCNATVQVGFKKTRFVGFNRKGTDTCVFPKTKSTQDKKAIASCLCVKFSSSGSGASMASAWKNMDGTSASSNTGSGDGNSGNTGTGGSGGSNSGNVSPKKLPSGTVAITAVLFVLLCCTGVAAVYFYFIKKDAPANYEAVQMS